MKNTFRHFRQFCGDIKLQSKFTLVLALSVIIPALILGAFLYGNLYDMVVSYTISREQNASTKTAPLVEETVKKITDAFGEITKAPFYKDLAALSDEADIQNLAESPEASSFGRFLDELKQDGLITSIRIYMDLPPQDEVLFSSPETKDFLRPVSSIQGTYWYGIFQGSRNLDELFCPSFYLGPKEASDNGSLAYIRPFTLHMEDARACYTAIYYSSSHLKEILSDNLSLEGSVSYIMNDRNALVSSSDSALSGIYWLDYDTIRDSFMSSNNFIERNILDTRVYAGFYSITRPGWFMVTVLPSRPLIRQSNTIMIQYVALYIVFLLLAFVMANYVSHSITNRISSVIRQMRQVREGPPVPMEDPAFHDEVGDLIGTYNFMTKKMTRLMEEQAKAAEDLRIAEFNSLQAQMNPHFLYNTMDMINWMALQGRNAEVSSAVQNLSRFYKLTLSRKESISTIADEEEHVSIYVKLQNMRYHDSIQLVSDIPDELMEYQIPRLTLQPVVENAIIHGILEKDSKSGTIVLTGWLEEEDIVLLISDDGVGIPEEKQRTILTGTGTSSSGGTNIAVFNTHRRLQILYGSRYGLSYSGKPGQGTEVQLRFPARKGPESVYLHPLP